MRTRTPKAIFGAGKAPNETAEVTDITGVDEFVNRVSQKKPSLEESATVFQRHGALLAAQHIDQQGSGTDDRAPEIASLPWGGGGDQTGIWLVRK